MKNQSENKFDGFIRSEIEDHTIDASFDKQWDKMSAALDKKDFRRFSFFRFNLYYLSAIVLGVGVFSLWFFSKNGTSLEKLKQGQDTTATIKVDKIQPGTDTHTKKISIQKNSSPNVGGTNTTGQKNDSSLVVKVETESDSKNKSDSSNTLRPITQNGFLIKDKKDSLRNMVVPKKIKYVVKRDTIINIDTNKVRKKR